MQQQPQYTCPRCSAPIYGGQAACSNCGLALDAQSLAAWQAAQGPGAPPIYGAPPPQPPPGYNAPPPGYTQPISPTYTPAPARPMRRGNPPWLTAVLGLIVLALIGCGVVAALSLGADNEAQRADTARATVTAIAQKLAAAPTAADFSGLPTRGTGPTPTLAPDDADLQILDFTDYTDDAGNLIVIGQVENQGKGLAHDIQVVGEALDVNKTPVASGNDLWLALVGLPPGAKAPYQIRMTKPTGKVESLHVRGSFKTFDPDAVHVFVPAAGLSVSNQQFTSAGAGDPAQVKGLVKNGGSKEATLVQVLISGYDSSGQLVGVTQGRVTDSIPAGGSAEFTATFDGPNDSDIAKVDVLAVGNEGK